MLDSFTKKLQQNHVANIITLPANDRMLVLTTPA